MSTPSPSKPGAVILSAEGAKEDVVAPAAARGGTDQSWCDHELLLRGQVEVDGAEIRPVSVALSEVAPTTRAIRLKDGTVLIADVCIPAGIILAGHKLPCIVQICRYGRAWEVSSLARKCCCCVPSLRSFGRMQRWVGG
jgi:hypothetical protein